MNILGYSCIMVIITAGGHQSPTSPGAVSPGGGSVSPATGGLSPQSGSPVGATVPLATMHEHPIYETQVRHHIAHTYDRLIGS